MRKKIVLNKGSLPEIVCIEYLLLMGLTSSYIEFSMIWKIVLFVLIGFLLVSKRRYREALANFSYKNVFFCIFVLLGFISIVLGRSNQYFFFNIRKWIPVIALLCLIDMLVGNEKLNIRSILKAHFFFLNFFWLANLIVLAFQNTGNGFMIKAEWLVQNGFYPDQCSGLFGNSGTHRLSLFAVFMLVYNLCVADETVEKGKKQGIYAFMVITQLWMLYLSIFNDNKTLFALIPFFFFLFIVFRTADKQQQLKNVLRKWGGIFGIIIFVGLSTLIFLTYYSNVSGYIKEYVINAAINLTTQGKAGGRGSIERLTIAIDALKKGYGFLFGDGLGAAAASEGISGRYRGYRHFSMSSMGTLVTLGGVWFYLFFCLVFTRVLVRSLKAKKKINWLLSLGAVIALTIYTPLFDSMVTVLWLCLTFIMYGNDVTKKSVAEEKLF